MNISEHFTLEEFTASQVATRRGIDNTPGPVELANLHRTATTMERVRAILGKPIHVDSGYRSPLVNTSVGGTSKSAHCYGLACDFVCPDFGTSYEVALAVLKSDIEYDQLILEYGWVHVGLAQKGTLLRREAMTKRSPWSVYESGIRA
jgi:zinc D-Ala-D-Ala carboxypeptidase